MPPPRKPSPRRRERRSRSRSYSPRHRRRSRSPSRSPRDRRRSRSPQRRRSPERKHRSPPRRRSPSPRRRSRTPKRRSRTHSPRRRSRSKSPRRKAPSPRRRSPSPDDRNHPVKRPADSSVKRHSFRSRSPSPKRSRDERLYKDESPYEQQRSSKHSRSPVHESPYGGKMYADQPSSSKQPLFPAGSSKRTSEIDFVTIVEKAPKKQKLNKRFETLEQVAQGAFDFEENITIGIHRGPQHIELDDDEDVEVNYEFNPKTFKMLFPKKNYVKAIFDRDEIKAFHHDDILDEEAYVEKRTISIKPVDKPKSRKHDDELDYRITVGSGREGYGDRRMVHDSGSRSRPSRSSGYDDVPVTVRLDPKPDPRYEKIYRDQQRYEDQSLMQEKVHRNPNDLRYNLMRRKSEGDRDGGRDTRDRHGGPSEMMDARSRIEARRQEGHRDDFPDRRDRPGDRRASRGSPPRSTERKRAPIKTDLPDFKNRPEKYKPPEPEWKVNPTVTPKGQSYYEHDSRSRDDMTFWERKQLYMKTGRYPSARGFRGRGSFRGRGRGGRQNFDQGFVKKTFGAAMDEWKHDKFDEVDAEEDSSPSKDRKDHKKDRKSDRQELKDDKNSRKEKSSSSRKESSSSRKDKESSRKEREPSSKKEKEMDREKERLAIRKEEESLEQELKVEVTIG